MGVDDIVAQVVHPQSVDVDVAGCDVLAGQNRESILGRSEYLRVLTAVRPINVDGRKWHDTWVRSTPRFVTAASLPESP